MMGWDTCNADGEKEDLFWNWFDTQGYLYMDVRTVPPLKTLRATIWGVDIGAAVLNFAVNVIVAAPLEACRT